MEMSGGYVKGEDPRHSPEKHIYDDDDDGHDDGATGSKEKWQEIIMQWKSLDGLPCIPGFLLHVPGAGSLYRRQQD